MYDFFINRKHTVKDLGVQLDSKLHFHAHVGCIFSKSVGMLGLIQTIADSLFTTIAY